MIELVVSPTSLDVIKKCDYCDAFIVGEKDKALRLPHYFSLEEIIDIIDICKNRKQKVYLAINKIIHEGELEKFSQYLDLIKDLTIDGIIFGDLAIYQLAKKYYIVDKLIYQPETYITNYKSAEFFAQKGIKRVVLAKEITLEDICIIASNKTTEIEILGHGALNMFHSMRYLVSNYFRFLKDDNPEKFRNEQLYIIEEKREDKYPIVEDDYGTHVFSANDLCTVNHLDTLIENNVDSIRIDGILKSDDELLSIVIIYRQAILDYYEDKNKYLKNKELYLKKLIDIKNIRPFNEGFLFKKTIYK